MHTVLQHEEHSLVATIQARNNARVVVSGSASLFFNAEIGCGCI